MAGGIAIVLSLAFTRGLITFFARLGKGQPILGAEDRGPQHHMHKQGTPTMGGIGSATSSGTSSSASASPRAACSCCC